MRTNRNQPPKKNGSDRLNGAVQELDLQVVRVERRGGDHGGRRPFKLDARVFILICRKIERGESAVSACHQLNVSYPTLRRFVHKKSRWMNRLHQAELIREHFLREFHINNILQHAHKNVAASMFWLERRFPNEFALRTVVRSTGDTSAPTVFDKISLEQLVANAELAQQIASNPPPGLSIPACAEPEN